MLAHALIGWGTRTPLAARLRAISADVATLNRPAMFVIAQEDNSITDEGTKLTILSIFPETVLREY